VVLNHLHLIIEKWKKYQIGLRGWHRCSWRDSVWTVNRSPGGFSQLCCNVGCSDWVCKRPIAYGWMLLDGLFVSWLVLNHGCLNGSWRRFFRLLSAPIILQALALQRPGYYLLQLCSDMRPRRIHQFKHRMICWLTCAANMISVELTRYWVGYDFYQGLFSSIR